MIALSQSANVSPILPHRNVVLEHNTGQHHKVNRNTPNGCKPVPSFCTFAGCSEKHKAKGLCVTHYRRMRRNGDPATVHRGGRQDVRTNLVKSLFTEWSA